MCCYAGGTTSCNQPLIASTSRKQRENEAFGDDVNSSLAVVLDQWMDKNLTSFITDLLIPLKMDLQERIRIQLLTDQTIDDIEQGCNIQEAKCMGDRVLSCATAQETEIFSSGLEKQRNTTEVEEEATYKESQVSNDGQIRLLSLSACMMQTFSANLDGGRQNALLAAKRCVRSLGYQWSTIRTCVWEEALVDLPPQPQPVNSLNLLEMKASLCSELSLEGISAVVCDLAMDEYEEKVATTAEQVEVQQPLAYVHYLEATAEGAESYQPMREENQPQQPMADGHLQQEQPMRVEIQPEQARGYEIIDYRQPMSILNDVPVNDDMYYD